VEQARQKKDTATIIGKDDSPGLREPPASQDVDRMKVTRRIGGTSPSVASPKPTTSLSYSYFEPSHPQRPLASQSCAMHCPWTG
jgi:hypothetical protein